MNLFVSDLDGTLLNSQKVLGQKTVSILNRLMQQGMMFTVATARSLDSARDILAPLNLSLPIVFFNGVFVYDPVKDIYLASRFLSGTSVGGLLSFFAQHRIQPLVYTKDPHEVSRVYYTGIHNQSEERFITDRLLQGDSRFRLVPLFKGVPYEHVHTINVIQTKDVLDPLVEEIRKKFQVSLHYAEDIYTPGYHWLEITQLQATKQHGVDFLKKHTGATRLICFGDHLNDLPMFDIADETYAVGNAHSAVKQAATGIIPTNNEEGVAHYLSQRMRPPS